MNDVVKGVAKYFKVKESKILNVVKGPQSVNEPRKLAMYLCQELTSARLTDIAHLFSLNHIGSVSHATHQIRQKKEQDKSFTRQLEIISASIVKQAK